MLELIVQIVFLVAISAFLLSRDSSVESVARIVAGAAAIVWVVLLLV